MFTAAVLCADECQTDQFMQLEQKTKAQVESGSGILEFYIRRIKDEFTLQKYFAIKHNFWLKLLKHKLGL
jgi:hypothetical protein